MHRKAILIFLFLPLKLLAQDITGVWTGTIYNDTTQKYIPYEIAISEEKGKLIGFSHSAFIEENSKKVIVKSIKIKIRDNKFFVDDEEWIYKNFPEPAPKGVKQHNVLTLTTIDSMMILSGPFNTNRTKEYLPNTGTIHLSRKKNFKQSEIIPKLDQLNLSKNLSFLHPKDTSALATAADLKKNVPPFEEKDIAVSESIEEKLQPSKQPLQKETVTVSTITQQKQPDIIQKGKVKDIVISLPKEDKKIQPVILPKEKQIVNIFAPKQIKNSETVSQPKKEITIVTQPASVKKEPTTNVLVKQKEIINQTTSPIQTHAPTITSTISAAKIATRKIETIKSVFIKSDSVTITLYDNGEVDGDIVSVLLNGKVIMPNVMLTSNAIKKTVYITPDLGDSLQLIMYAENLGSIPPNTGLLILQDGDDRYEIRFAGDMQKNSAIILRRKSLSH